MGWQKEALRARLNARRQEMSAADVAALSAKAIARALALVDWAHTASLHTYLPIAKEREVDTRLLLGEVWRTYPAVKTATWQEPTKDTLPVWILPDGTTEPVALPQQFDVIIVPLLGFNDTGHRIGYGSGFYDRFLPTQPNALTVGLCYAFGHAAAFQAEPHDIPLNHIVTENMTIAIAGTKRA